MRRTLKWLVWIVVVLIALPLVAIVTILGIANTDPGRRLIERQTASLTGGVVRLQDVSGRFPEALRVGRIEVSDAKGPYISIDQLVLNWSPLQLLGRTAKIDQLTATRVDFSRLP